MQATIGPLTYTVQIAGWQPSDRLGSRKTLSFEVQETDGIFFQSGEQVSVTDPTIGDTFTGFVESNEMSYLPGTQIRSHKLTCKSEEYLADKRYFTNPDKGKRYAGDYALDVVNDYLAIEGVTAKAAMRHDKSASDFAQGTLSHVIVENGALTLAHNGTTFTVTENTQSALGAGTLTNVQANVDGTLTLSSMQAIAFSGQCTTPSSVTASAGRKIWSGSHSVASGDLLQYGIWIASTSPGDSACVELVFSDNSTLTSIGGFVDQYGIAATGASLAGNATDTWFFRQIDLTAAAGKTIAGANVLIQGQKDGNYAVWYRGIVQTDSTGTTIKTTFFGNTLQSNSQIGGTGYQNVLLTQVTAYEKIGERVSPSYSNTVCNSVKGSIVGWQETLPTQVAGSGSGKSSAQPLTISVSLDGGGFYYPASTAGQPVPGLLPGTSIASSFIRFDIILQNLGSDPTFTPSLSNLSLTIDPGYYQVKTDVVDSAVVQADFGTGTLTNVTNYANGLTLTGSFKDWHDGSLTNQDLRGTGNAAQAISLANLQLLCDSGHDVRSRLTFAGQWQNFVCEMDMLLAVGGGQTTSGIVYRTTNWTGNDQTYAWLAYITDTSVVLGYGTDSGASSFTPMATVAASLTVGNWYRMKLVVSGTSHQVYLDGQLYISITDSHFNQSGYIGARFSNTAGVRKYGMFANFGVVVATSGSRVNPSLDLSAAGTYARSLIQWSSVVPNVCSLLIEASLDGGLTWMTCTNGAPIPGLTYGQSLSGVHLLVRETLLTNNANATSRLYALKSIISGQTSGSDGTRVSYPLAVTNVGQIDSTAVTWEVTSPTLTTFRVETSIDAQATWQTVAASGNPIPGILVGGPDYVADMHTNDFANWTNTYYSGGADATWEWDIDNFLLAARDGTQAVYVLSQTTSVDSGGNLITSRSDDGGVLLRYTDVNNHYRVVIHDDLSASSPQTITLFKRVAGTDTQLAQVSIGFIRGEFHHFSWNITGTAITLSWDGATVLSTTDSAISTCTQSAALYNGSGTAWWHVFRSQQFGQSITGTFTLASDTFGRTNSGTWNTASDGVNVWSTVSGSPTLNVGAGVGTIAATALSTVYMQLGTGSTTDMEILCDLKKASTNANGDFVGVLGRFVDINNWYRVVIGGLGHVLLHKRVGGVQTQLVSLNMTIADNTFYTVRFNITGKTLSLKVWQTGTAEPTAWLYQTTDTDLTVGGWGVYANPLTTGVALTYGNFSVTAQKSIYTRIHMSTDDASVSAQLSDLTLSVRSKDVQGGAWMTNTNYKHNNTCASTFDDMAKQSDCQWSIKKRAFTFQERPVVFAPWPMASIDLDLLNTTPPVLKSYAPLYRNRQFITGAFDTIGVTGEEKRGDNSATSWALAYPVYSAPTITLNGVAQTVGVAGVDTGKQFYWTYKSPTLGRDKSLSKLTNADVISADYTGLIDYVAQADNTAQQTALQVLEGGSGIVEAIESCNGLLKDAADQLAEARLNQFAVLSLEWNFSTLRAGLASGMIQYTYVPEYDLNNVDFLITDVSPTVEGLLHDGTPFVRYAVKATSGPSLGSWSRLFLPLGG